MVIIALSLQRQKNKRCLLFEQCENSSVGRARPCQGRGRGFESRFSLSRDWMIIQSFFYPSSYGRLSDFL